MKKLIIIISILALVWIAYKIIKDPTGSGLWILNTAASLKGDYSKTKNIQYGNEPWQRLDIYQSKSSKDNSSALNNTHPVLVFLYGGGWTAGDKSQYEFIAQSFVERGYLVVVPNYILYPQGKFPQFVDDTAKAIAWVSENIEAYNGDNQQLFLVGHSAGAYNAAMAAVNDTYLQKHGKSSNIIKAFAGVAGPYNFTPKAQKYIDIFGEENFESMKVMNHANGNEPPMLLLHSEGDNTVALFNQATMVGVLKGNQIQVESKLYSKDLSHIRILLNIHPWFANDENVGQDIDEFFKRFQSE